MNLKIQLKIREQTLQIIPRVKIQQTVQTILKIAAINLVATVRIWTADINTGNVTGSKSL